jgi:hypothetical protein
MTPENGTPRGKDRPFPWLCIECGKEEIFPCKTDYTTTQLHDGQSYEIHISDLEIPTCRNCGDRLFTSRVDNRIVAAMRAHVGLLTPQEMESKRCELALSEQEVADELGVTEETYRNWEGGWVIQSRAMDVLLRSTFDRLDRARRMTPNQVEPIPSGLQSTYGN